jgi:hypothetical protein
MEPNRISVAPISPELIITLTSPKSLFVASLMFARASKGHFYFKSVLSVCVFVSVTLSHI